MSALKRTWFAVLLIAPVMATPLSNAKADEALSYGDQVKAKVGRLLQGRNFSPDAGCDDKALCAALLARLRDMDFNVVEPAERSDKPDFSDYRRVRSRCPALDPMGVKVGHRAYAPTRGFALYRLDLSRRHGSAGEILVFRAQHYVQVGAAAKDDEQIELTPGTFVAVNPRTCRLLATARSVDGEWLAKRDDIGTGDHASELLKIGDRFFVLNIAPIAGPWQSKASWSYTLELWDLGPHADADWRKQKHVYSFTYTPTASVSANGVNVPDWARWIIVFIVERPELAYQFGR